MTEAPAPDTTALTVDMLRRELALQDRGYDNKLASLRELLDSRINAEKELRAEMFAASKSDRLHLSERLDRQSIDINQLRSRMDQGEGGQSKAQTVQAFTFSVLGVLLLALSVGWAIYSAMHPAAPR